MKTKNWKASPSLVEFPNHSSILKIIHIVFGLKNIFLFLFLYIYNYIFPYMHEFETGRVCPWAQPKSLKH